MVKGIEPSHHVGRDLLPGIGVGANGVDLIALITAPVSLTNPLQFKSRPGFP